MSRFHMKGSRVRAVLLTAMMSAPLTAFALPQAGTVTAAAAPRAAGSRARCVGCSDSARARHEMLVERLDSLAWLFNNRRLTQPERETIARDMDTTLAALRQFMEASGARLRLAPSARAEAMAGSGVAGGESYTITVQQPRRGYLGVTFDGPMFGYPAGPSPDVIRFIQYPKIASVDPASPAELAGLLMGDTLVAMNGTDVVENAITLSKLLVPDEKLTVKVRRDGDAKEFRVVVAEAPPFVARRAMPSQEVVAFVPTPYPPEAGGAAPSVRSEVRARRAPEPPSASRVFEAPVMTRGMFVFGNAVGGARVETVTEGLGKAIGVKEGVLVIQVPPGSPAYTSGLRDGDVIVSAAGKAVTSVRQLTESLRSTGREDGVKLVVVRDKKQQDVTLRWR